MYDESSLYNLAYNCPSLQRKGDCSFMPLEHLTFKEKVDWIEDLCAKRKRVIWEQHMTCPQI